MSGHDRSPVRHGLSLVELLMAIFILGIGIISIAALFPAGIAQQRQSVDDVVGPIVANNALAVLRSKLRDDDFAVDVSIPGFIHGDFPWSRPAFVLNGSLRGAISIFNDTNLPATMTETEVPYNPAAFPNLSVPPLIVLTRGERAFPMYSESSSSDAAIEPQYFWECMFRRFQGRLYVAVFVYRVTNPPGERSIYTIAENPDDNDIPALPYYLDLDPTFVTNNPTHNGPWDAPKFDNEPIIGTADGETYDARNQDQSWQEPRQWILDQNNNIHQVLSRFESNTGDLEVELVRPVAEMPDLAVYAFPEATVADTDGNTFLDRDIVGRLWYVPVVDSEGRSLTPVYLLVEEL